MTIPVHVALVDQSGRYRQQELAKMAGALSEQVLHDFAPIWKVNASVGAYASAPADTWAVIIETTLDEPGALGYHTDDHNQPIAFVEYTGADTSITVSHELLEMLADPFGNRFHGARLPEGLESRYTTFGLKHASSHVQYLLEVCDPCEATSYEVGGVEVSDFLYPDWYRTNPPVHPHYSLQGMPAPRTVAEGGYVSFMNPATREWYQVFARGGELEASAIGKFDKKAFGSVREFADHHSREQRGAE